MPVDPRARARGEKGERIVGLDGLRGLAAFGVLLYHFTSRYQDFGAFSSRLPFTFPDGRFGVHLFFIISGFVIFMTVERAKWPLDFVKSRFVRLYPAFWLSLSIAFALHAATRGPSAPLGWDTLLRRTAVNLTMVPSWFHVEVINGVYWTLSIEMTFYAIMFALLYCNRIDRTIPVLTAIVGLVLLDRLVALRWPNPVTPWLRAGLGLDYLHVILLGVLIYKTRQGARPIHAIIGLFCMLPFFRIQAANVESFKPALITATFAIIVFLATTGRLRVLEWRPLVFLGTISYSLYLNHELMGYRIIFHAQRLGLSPGVSIALATVSALVVATVITYVFEQPVTAALRRRLRSAGGKASSESSAGLYARGPGDFGFSQPSLAVRNWGMDQLAVTPASEGRKPPVDATQGRG